MSNNKYVEIRDKNTMIPAVIINLEVNPATRYTGHGRETLLLMKLSNYQTHGDPNHWNDRTMKAAHQHVYRNWKAIKDGDVIDIEYLFGETTEPKTPNLDGWIN